MWQRVGGWQSEIQTNRAKKKAAAAAAAAAASAPPPESSYLASPQMKETRGKDGYWIIGVTCLVVSLINLHTRRQELAALAAAEKERKEETARSSFCETSEPKESRILPME